MGANRSPWAIGEIVKARVAIAGVVGDFGAHSLRSGFATAAARGGYGEAAIMKHGWWKSVAVARRYIRASNRWDQCAAFFDVSTVCNLPSSTIF